MKAIGNATAVEIPCSEGRMTSTFLPLYEACNKKELSIEAEASSAYKPLADIVYRAFGQKIPKIVPSKVRKAQLDASNASDVLLAFSCGLDSVFQAIELKKKGYNVHLFFMKNANTYENGQAFKHADTIAEKLGLDIIYGTMSKSFKKDNPWRQQWPENPLKNQLIYSAMADICIERGWSQISAGDDFNLHLQDAVPGINLTDAFEVTKAFLDGAQKLASGLKFIPISQGHEKLERLQAMIAAGLQDDFYSCVQSGRFQKSFHEKQQKKYSIKLFQSNCGSCCRKCAMHNLLLHYGKVTAFPAQFINACWERMWKNAHSADYKFFSPDLSLDQRIKNLFTY